MKRCYGREQDVFDLLHYLFLLQSGGDWLAQLKGVTGLAGKLDPDSFCLRVFAQTVKAVFRADAAHLVAAKGRIEG